MLALIQRRLIVLTSALVLGYATSAPAASPDADRQLSSALEQALPSLVLSGDYGSASKLYFQLAATRSRLKDTAAACTALSESLAYYRKALARDTAQPEDAAGDFSLLVMPFSTASGSDDGLAVVRSQFGCASTWPALSDGSAGSLERVLPTLVSTGEYRTASKLYFQLAAERSRLKETAAACAALSRSLAYYRKAIANESGVPSDAAATDSGSDDGLAVVRSQFGCASI